MELVQIYPTCIYHHQAKKYLISEAVRGKSTLLFDKEGRRFLYDYEHEKKGIGDKRNVTRAIDSEMKKTEEDSVYLDICHDGRKFLEKRFLTIF